MKRSLSQIIQKGAAGDPGKPVTPKPKKPATRQPKPAPEPAPPVQSRAKQTGHGKRADPNYTQALAYLPADLYLEVKRRLIGTDQQYSELVTELLREWLRKGG